MTRLHAGVDIGGSHIAVGLVDEVGNLLLTVDHQLLCNASVTADEIVGIIYTLISQATFTLCDVETNGGDDGCFGDGLFNSCIATVGIGCPGHCKKGVLVAASNLPLLKNVPLAAKLSARLDNIPVVLVNDADAAVAAEVWSKDTFAFYREAENVAMVTLGTGVGVGLVLNRRLYTGSNGLVEAGHMVIPAPMGASSRQCGCGQRNCVETFASAKSVALRYAEATSSVAGADADADADADSNALSVRVEEDVDTKGVFHLAADGDPVAERIIDDAAKSLAVLVVNLCRVVDLDVVIFGGGMAQAGETLLHRIRAHVKATSWNVLPTNVQMVLAKSSVNAGILGAAMAGKRQAELAGGREGGKVGDLMRRYGQGLLAFTTAVSVVSLATIAVLVLRRKK